MSSASTSGTQPKPLTTANSMVEGPREKPPQLYNPFNRKEAAPLDPEDFIGQAKFKYDDFLETRTMPRRNVHGRSEDQFDVEQARPSEKYLSKLQKHNFLEDVEEDPRIMDERGAAHFDQPPEVLAQLRADFRNPKFLAVLKRRTTRAGVSAEGDTRSSSADAQTPSAEKVAVVRMPMAQTARDPADASNPDFFTSAGQFDGFNAHREARRRDYEAAEVIRKLVENDPDGLALLVPEVIDDPPPPPPPAMVEGESTLLTKAQAAKLLDVNPLRMLRLNARSDLMQLPDANAVYRLLQPIVLQHEEHRRHFNIVELVREMNVRGAKYDGCVQMHTAHRLGALVDQNFYKSFLDAASGVLVGGHEHADAAGNTHICVFKFYLVQRTKENAQLLQIVDERGQAVRTEKRKVTADDEEMRLNQAGVYDIDLEDTEADMTATDGYGSMHDIRHLQREFMLSLRLVCVECEEPPDEQPAAAPELCVDIDEDDDFADELMSETLEAGSHTFDMGAQASDTEAFMQSLEGRAAAQQRSRVSSRIDEAAEPETRIAAEEGGQGFPEEQLKLTLEQAARLVGKLRAPQFQQRVNSHTIRLLCPRAFMFYAIDAGGE